MSGPAYKGCDQREFRAMWFRSGLIEFLPQYFIATQYHNVYLSRFITINNTHKDVLFVWLLCWWSERSTSRLLPVRWESIIPIKCCHLVTCPINARYALEYSTTQRWASYPLFTTRLGWLYLYDRLLIISDWKRRNISLLGWWEERVVSLMSHGSCSLLTVLELVGVYKNEMGPVNGTNFLSYNKT